MNALFERRSIRKYTPQSVPPELIERIIRAGMAAPSASDERPWHFIVINDKNTLLDIAKIHPYAQMLKIASSAIVVCGEPALQHNGDFWVQDCSAATENMLLAAQKLGLGSVWVGVYPMEDRVKSLKALLNIPEGIVPLCILPVGYPAEHKEPANRYNPARIRFNRWE